MWVRKIFLFDKITSRNLAQIIVQGKATISEHIFGIRSLYHISANKLTNQNQNTDHFIPFYALSKTAVNGIIATVQSKLTFFRVICTLVCAYLHTCQATARKRQTLL